MGEPEPFVSLARLFLACSLSPVEGLLRFELDNIGYSTTLGGLAPVFDLWVPLSIARDVADELDRLDELAALLEWETRQAYSVEDKEEGGLVHNWKIGADWLDPQDYSTASMLSTSFPRIQLLPSGTQVRTLLPPLSSIPPFTPASDQPSRTESSFDALWCKLVEWSAHTYEAWLDSLDSTSHQHTPAAPPDSLAAQSRSLRPASPSSPADIQTSGGADLTPYYLFSTLVPLLRLQDLPTPPSPSIAPSTNPLSSLSYLPSLPPLSRASLLPPPPGTERRASDAPPVPPHAALYLVDAICRIALHGYCTGAESAPSGAHGALAGQREREGRRSAAAAQTWADQVDERLEALELCSKGIDTGQGTAREDEEAGKTEEAKAQRARLARIEAGVQRLVAQSTATLRTGTSAPSAVNRGVLVQQWRLLVGVFVAGVAVGAGLAMQT
ncbi:uncharacterized protein JCM10292_001711 [Rhodotorula paludigena]|uniref:uncharacterized protein n=1 Tax=Rhodotorula paludigena TaxID=86838 RepID=UPI00317CE8DE